MKLGCVIMASGEGKRFGSNKMLADIYGEGAADCPDHRFGSPGL